MNDRQKLKQLSKSEIIDILLDMQKQYQLDSEKYHELLAENIELHMQGDVFEIGTLDIQALPTGYVLLSCGKESITINQEGVSDLIDALQEVLILVV